MSAGVEEDVMLAVDGRKRGKERKAKQGRACLEALVRHLGDAVLDVLGRLLSALDEQQAVVEELAGHARGQELAARRQLGVDGLVVERVEGAGGGLDGVEGGPVG